MSEYDVMMFSFICFAAILLLVMNLIFFAINNKVILAFKYNYIKFRFKQWVKSLRRKP